jgi:hypothetical protein
MDDDRIVDVAGAEPAEPADPDRIDPAGIDGDA